MDFGLTDYFFGADEAKPTPVSKRARARSASPASSVRAYEQEIHYTNSRHSESQAHTYWCPKANAWRKYEVDEWLVFVIAPGAGMLMNRQLYDTLEAAGYTVQALGISQRYDVYPDKFTKQGWQPAKGETLQQLEKRHCACNGGVNLATLATDVISHQILAHINATGKGPCAIVCGSRGGQVTLHMVQTYVLRCPAVVLNAGNVLCSAPFNGPLGTARCPLVLCTFGKDYFQSANPRIIHSWFKALWRESCSNVPLEAWQIHVSKDEHLPRWLRADIVSVIQLATWGADKRFAPPNEREWREELVWTTATVEKMCVSAVGNDNGHTTAVKQPKLNSSTSTLYASPTKKNNPKAKSEKAPGWTGDSFMYV